MKKPIGWALLLILSLGESVWANEKAEDAAQGGGRVEKSEKPDPVPSTEDSGESSAKTFSSAVNVLRKNDRIEAVFRNGEVYALPRGSRQHAIFSALEESERTGKAVSVTVDEKTGVIRSVGGAASAGERKK